MPFDGSVVDSWRECDVASIARNFSRDGLNILEPRIDWRGDGPGLVESEFPIFPWLVALLYRVFGQHDILGRLVALTFSLAGMATAIALARRLLPSRAALVATGFIALSPLVVRLGTALQPDGLMWFAYVGSVYAFLRWLDEETWRWYVIALGATALAILAKASAAHIGFLLFALLLDRRGAAGLRDVRVWALALAALLPGVLWYAHARGYYHTYGNSLGISSEDHWAGLDLLTDPRLAMRMVALELFAVWTPAGALLAAAGAVLRLRDLPVRVALYWLAAAAVFYLVAARTTSDSWAIHYHVMTIMPVALLVGSGAEALLDRPKGDRAWLMLGGAAVLLAAALYLMGARGLGGSESGWFTVYALILALSGVVALLVWRGPPRLGALPGIAAVLGAMMLFQGRVIGEYLKPRQLGAFACSAEFAKHVPAGTLIAAPGDRCFDEGGHRTAFEAPFYFYWMDRKGFSVCSERQQVDTLRALARRGARYYVATRGSLTDHPGLEEQLRSTFVLVAECRGELLFRLDETGP